MLPRSRKSIVWERAGHGYPPTCVSGGKTLAKISTRLLGALGFGLLELCVQYVYNVCLRVAYQYPARAPSQMPPSPCRGPTLVYSFLLG